MPKWIDHIVVRVKDLDQSLADYEGKLGMKAKDEPEDRPDLGMRRAILPLGDSGRFIELAEPLGDGGAIGKALEKQGEGLHLVALAVDDLQAEAAVMRAGGANLIEAGNMIFVHPKDSHGVLYQLIERK